jgi:pyridoxal phosphate phosphatase PHOSPHO2
MSRGEGVAQSAQSAPVLLCLDFDHTVIDVNSDTYVIEQLSAHVAAEQRTLFSTMQWTDLMARTMVLLAEAGITKEAMLAALQAVPMPKEMVSALHHAHVEGATIIIVSDANEVFIR